MSLYAFLIGATASGTCDPLLLQRQIEEDAAIPTACLGITVVEQLTILIEFSATLSGPEIAALNAVVAAHYPGPPTEEPTRLTTDNVVFDSQGRLVYDGNDRVLVTS